MNNKACVRNKIILLKTCKQRRDFIDQGFVVLLSIRSASWRTPVRQQLY